MSKVNLTRTVIFLTLVVAVFFTFDTAIPVYKVNKNAELALIECGKGNVSWVTKEGYQCKV